MLLFRTFDTTFLLVVISVLAIYRILTSGSPIQLFNDFYNGQDKDLVCRLVIHMGTVV